MTNFVFQTTDEDGVTVTVEFEAEVWLDAFPKFLQLCRGSGFIVDEATAMYAPTASRQLFDDREFLIFDDELKYSEDDRGMNMFAAAPCEHMSEDEQPFPMTSCSESDNMPCSKTLEEWIAEGHCIGGTAQWQGDTQHTDCYYDCSRNK